jgi:hypothetical protein
MAALPIGWPVVLIKALVIKALVIKALVIKALVIKALGKPTESR